jgi:hypothetical protein
MDAYLPGGFAIVAGRMACALHVLVLYKSVFVTGKPVMLVGRLQEILQGAGVVEDC